MAITPDTAATSDTTHYDDLNPLTFCLDCDVPGRGMGRLGRFVWFRCPCCSWEWPVEFAKLHEELDEALEAVG